MTYIQPEDKLKELQEFIKEFHHQKYFVCVGHKLYDLPTPLERLMYAQQAFYAGAIPDTITLLYIAESIGRYVRNEGKISLDEAFRLKSVPAQGNPSRQHAHNNKLNWILFEMAYVRAQSKLNHKRMSLENAATLAAQISSNENEFSNDTLVKYYKEKNGDRMRDIMIRDGRLEKGKLIF